MEFSESINLGIPDPEFDRLYDGEIDGDAPLYKGSSVSLNELMVLILQFVLRHNLKMTAVDDLLPILELIIPDKTDLPRTVYKFKQFFGKCSFIKNKRVFCKCMRELENEKSTCPSCKKGTKLQFLLNLSVKDQMTYIYGFEGFEEKLQYKKKIFDRKSDEKSDIFHGDQYAKFLEAYPFILDHYNVSLAWYTDGFPVFVKSKYGVWEYKFNINEISPENRRKKEFNITAALWCGSVHSPPFNELLRYTKDELEELKEGFPVTLHGHKIPITVRTALFAGRCDLQAKAKMFYMQQHNGKNGCMNCYQESTRCTCCTNVQVYNYSDQIVYRTTEEAIQYGIEAWERGKVVKGHKSVALIALMAFNFIETTSVDWMHNLFTGHLPQLFELYFGPKYKKYPFSLHAHIQEINLYNASANPHSNIQRLPRDITDSSIWKASDYKNWFFYYSLPILSEIMKSEYLEPYKQLVFGVSLLCAATVTQRMIDDAHHALRSYELNFSQLYPNRQMVMNVHLLIHLSNSVQQLGPLWANGCFDDEDFNGTLKKMVKSSNKPHLQICSSISMFFNFSKIKVEKIVRGTVAYELMERMSSKHGRLKRLQLEDGIHLIGKHFRLPKELELDLREFLATRGINATRIDQYHRFLRHKILYRATSYQRATRTNNSVAVLSSENKEVRCVINTFVQIYFCSCNYKCSCKSQVYALVRLFEDDYAFYTNDGKYLSGMYRKKQLSNTMEVVDTDHLKTFCYAIKNRKTRYMIEPVNNIERE